jgi:shikimate kinase
MVGNRSGPEEVSLRLVATAAPIIILGMTAVAKTTTGRLLAGLAGLEFVDSDHEIECRTGRTCADIKINSGESMFRELEESVVLSLLDRRDCVVALGVELGCSSACGKRPNEWERPYGSARPKK